MERELYCCRERDRDQEKWLTVFYAKFSHQRGSGAGTSTWTGSGTDGLPNQFCTFPGHYEGALYRSQCVLFWCQFHCQYSLFCLWGEGGGIPVSVGGYPRPSRGRGKGDRVTWSAYRQDLDRMHPTTCKQTNTSDITFPHAYVVGKKRNVFQLNR